MTTAPFARRAWIALLTLALVAVLAACGSNGGSDGDRGDTADEEAAPETAPVDAIGTYAVGRTTHTFVDTSRPTGPNGSFPGSPERTLLTTIYYPAEGTFSDEPVDDAAPITDAGEFPLILFSHGVTARGTVYENNLEQWASAGYVVAAPDYPLSNTNAPGGVNFSVGVGDVPNQPEDASFVLDEVIALDESGELIEGVIDPDMIGAGGHSLGGITTFQWVYETCCTEERVDAAIAMSGSAGTADAFFTGVDTPLLVMHGDADPLVRYQNGVDAYALANSPKLFLTFTGAGHVTPFVGGDDAQAVVLNAAAVAFFDLYLKGDTGALERIEQTASDPAVATLQEQVGE